MRRLPRRRWRLLCEASRRSAATRRREEGCVRRAAASRGWPSHRWRAPRQGGSRCVSARGPHGSVDRPTSAIRDRRPRPPAWLRTRGSGRSAAIARSPPAWSRSTRCPFSTAATDSAGAHAVEPLSGQLAQRRARRLGLLDGLLTLQRCRQPAENLGALLERVRPHHPTLLGLPTAATVGRLAAAPCPIGGAGRATRLMAHVHTGSLCLAVLRHSDLPIRVCAAYGRVRRHHAVF